MPLAAMVVASALTQLACAAGFHLAIVGNAPQRGLRYCLLCLRLSLLAICLGYGYGGSASRSPAEHYSCWLVL